ncbi:MAG: PHP domain-containing protein [Selenomonas sp.]|uniref:PHP domain-containing protein n=1 Tax=Selenomonas sp. TaxID=2053611 RepID=UPI0025E6A59E|nr:PHP domain-containing protein [Selenomonas sp.]MCR5757244.1 PHP domain-containing protein [Selenomonas sp.]
MKKIDLHVHSLVSDGSFTPAELAFHAKEQGLTAFALTDHDVLAGTEEAAAAAEKAGVEFINGMELTADFQDHKIHVVCLGFDPQNNAFQAMYKKIRSIKEGRIADIVEFVRRKGIDISMEKVQQFSYKGLLDRYAVMRYLVSLHLYDRAQPLWDNYLNPAVEEVGLDFNITAEEALPVIHEAGGVTSLAHFHKAIGLGNLANRQQQEQAIVELHHLGLDGMERFYPNYTVEDEEFAAAMISKYDLLPTGGTDFHGTNRPGIELGTGKDGNMEVPYAFFQEVKERLNP